MEKIDLIKVARPLSLDDVFPDRQRLRMPCEVANEETKVNEEVIAEEEEVEESGDNVINGEANAATQSQVESEEKGEMVGGKENPKIVVVEPEEDTEKVDEQAAETVESEVKVEMENQERESDVSVAEGKVAEEKVESKPELEKGANEEKPPEEAQEVEPRSVNEIPESGDEMMLVPNSTLASMMEQGDANAADEVKDGTEQVEEKEDTPTSNQQAASEREAKEEVETKKVEAKEEVVAKVEVVTKEEITARIEDELKAVGAQMEQRVEAEIKALVSLHGKIILFSIENNFLPTMIFFMENFLPTMIFCDQVKNAGWDPAIKQRIQTTPNGWQLLSV